jgi:hypothetical protein
MASAIGAPNPAFNPDRPQAALVGSLRAARSGGRLTLRLGVSRSHHHPRRRV